MPAELQRGLQAVAISDSRNYKEIEVLQIDLATLLRRGLPGTILIDLPGEGVLPANRQVGGIPLNPLDHLVRKAAISGPDRGRIVGSRCLVCPSPLVTLPALADEGQGGLTPIWGRVTVRATHTVMTMDRTARLTISGHMAGARLKGK